LEEDDVVIVESGDYLEDLMHQQPIKRPSYMKTMQVEDEAPQLAKEK
jgi:hypothetical protein